MGFQKIDKKQVPQVIGLGVASCSMFGYFAFKMIAPTASAAPPAAAKTVKPADAAAKPDAVADAPPIPDAQPPSPGMRDPFVPTISDKVAPPAPPAQPAAKTRVASLEGSNGPAHAVPVVPPLPSPGGGAGPVPVLPRLGDRAEPNPATSSLPPMPVTPPAPVAPSWTVTGVLQSGAGNIAILRSGDERRIVQAGDVVDGAFRIVDVTHASVVLRRGSARYVLPLGGPLSPAAKSRKRSMPGTAFHGAPDLDTPTAPAVPAPAPAVSLLRPAAFVPAVGRVNPLLLVRGFRPATTDAEMDGQIAQFRQAVKQAPKFAAAHVILGVLLYHKGQLAEAIREDRAALQLKPASHSTRALAHTGLGLALSDQGHVDEALRECRTAVRLKPDMAVVHNNLAEVLVGSDQPDRAIAECRKAAALKPPPEVQAALDNNRGLALQKKGDLSAAMASFQKSLQITPDAAVTHNNLGFVLFLRGKTDAAIAEFQESLRLNPHDPKARKNLSDALALTGKSL